MGKNLIREEKNNSVKKKNVSTKQLRKTMIKPLKYNNGLAWLFIFILFCSSVYILRSVLLPFVAGIVLGYLFDPLASKFEKFGISRTLATILVFLVVILFAVPTLIMIFSVVDKQLTIFVDAAPSYISAFMKRMEPTLLELHNSFPSLEVNTLPEMIKNNLTNGMQIGGKLLKSIISNGFALMNLLSLLLITPVVAFYMLRDWNTFVKKIDNLLPRKSKNTIKEQFKQIDRALSGFIRGQLSVCLILGSYYALGLHIVGLELGLLVGFLAGIISFIPYVGSISGFLISIILASAQFGSVTKIIEVVAVFLIGQFIEGNFLTPKLVGDKIGLHPVWVMFALLAGGVLLGFLGLMIAVPVAAIIGVIIRYAISNYKKSSLYLED